MRGTRFGTPDVVRGPRGAGRRMQGLRRLMIVLAVACSKGDGHLPSTEPPVDSIPIAPRGGPAPAVHVQGNRIVDSLGRVVPLRGVNRSGGEYACAQGWGMMDGPSDSASVAAIASWKVTIVRVPMNETCWLGINGVKPEYSGANYQTFIRNFVTLLNRAGMLVILDLHWAAPDTMVALGQHPMPNRDHTPEFWRQVAAAYKGNNAVIFDLFNEPFPDNNRDTDEAWRCWRDGGTCGGVGFTAAGMQELVTAVRSTGATNVIMLGGVQYASGLSRWLDNRPTDPLNNLVASWHVYNFSGCHDATCWGAFPVIVARQAPIILGELGQDDYGSEWVTSLMNFADAHNIGYLAWTWDVWHSPLDLISSYDGTATSYGQTFKSRFGG